MPHHEDIQLMKHPTFRPVALLLPLTLLGQAPDNGQTLVLKQEKGIQLVRFFGVASVNAFFPGPGFTWVEADKNNPDPTFWVDGMLVQWMHFTREEIGCKRALKGQDLVEFYFRYETSYLRQVANVDASQLHIERFSFTGDQASDGLKHHFLIWSATPNGGNTKQYWVATDHPQGLMVMSLIPSQPADENKIKTLIDSYMASYSVLRPDEAAFRLNQFHDFERQKTPPQVPSMKRLRGEQLGQSTIKFPAGADQGAR